MSQAPLSIEARIRAVLSERGPLTGPEAIALLPDVNPATVRSTLSAYFHRTKERRDNNGVYALNEAEAALMAAPDVIEAKAPPPAPVPKAAPKPEPAPPPPTHLLIAENPQQLVDSQRSMIASMDPKIEAAKDEAQQAKKMRDQMRAVKLGSGPAERLHRNATERVHFLTKIKAALEAGYVMMPDMPGEVLAVRTDRSTASSTGWRERWAFPDEPAKYAMPVGTSMYRNPRPELESREITEHGKHVRWESRATWLRNPSGLDHKFLKPAVVDRMTGAMMKGIFDEIVCIGATAPPRSTGRLADPDPIVLGRVISKRQVCSFLIAWFMDLREI